MLGVNLWGVIHGIEAFLPQMLESGDEAHVVNASSINGVVPSAFSAIYSTSKYGVLGLTETLHNGLVGANVGVSALCPAGVNTRIAESERNRPAAPDPATPAPVHVPSSSFELSPFREPDVVGEMTLQGVQNERLYIFTDIKVRDLIVTHRDRMLATFDHLVAFQSGATTHRPTRGPAR